MSKINDGGPAFPESGSRGQASGGEGMSLRDYFASRMMPSQLAMELKPYDDYNYMNAAKRCYRMADAMLRAREEK